MDTKFTKRNIDLSLELDKYIARHPEILDRIPSRAVFVVTVKNDEEFNRYSHQLVNESRSRNIFEAEKSGRKWNLKPVHS